MNEETELKLSIAATDIDRLRRRAPLARVTPTETPLAAIYFDTADRLLRARGMGLRVRREGRRWIQTLKTASSTGGALSRRGEWSTPVQCEGARARIDPSALRGSALPRLLARRGGVAALKPVFRTQVRRTAWTLSYKGAAIEVALDVGELRATVGGRVQVEPIREVELELKSGPAARLLDLAIALVGRGDDMIALLPLARSKAERGYALAAGETAATVKANAAGFRAGIAPEMSSAAALRAVVAHGLTVVVANAETARGGYEPELIHQARVALRRMRSAARLFDRHSRDLKPPLVRELRWLAQSIGVARDADVLVGATLPAWRAAEANKGVLARHLAANAVRERAAAHRAAAACLASARFARATLLLHRWSISKPPSRKALQAVAVRKLTTAHARLLRAARFLSAASPQKRHEVRILAKRLRYALDLLGVVLPAPALALYLNKLAALQDELGALNDLAVADAWLDRIEASAAVIALRSWIAVTVAGLIAPTEERLEALRETSPPWI